MKAAIAAMFWILLLSCVFAEEPAPPKDVMFAGHAMDSPLPGTFAFISSEFGMEEKVVRGAPYSAEAITERIQNLPDGNRIVQKNSAVIYRDSQGRTRREQELGVIGNWAASGEPPKMISLFDPVKGTLCILEPETKTARKFPGKPHELLQAKSGPEVRLNVLKAPLPSSGKTFEIQLYKSAREGKTESLGRRLIEGIEAEGTRTVSTIAAGEIGNELPIQIVSEKWYAPALQIHVLTKHTDPRFGETTYRVTNIQRAEPIPALFDVPAGYKMEKALQEKVIIEKR